MSVSCNLGNAPPVPVLIKPHTQLCGFCFCGARQLLTMPFKSVLLDAADATGGTNLVAHRGSNFL